MATASSVTDEFQLVVLETARTVTVKLGSALTVPCCLSPEISVADMEIRWFKKTDCVCLYKNREVIEGIIYKDKVSLFTEELERGDVSLSLAHFMWSDLGDYVCQVISGDRTEEITIRIKKKLWRLQRDSRWSGGMERTLSKDSLDVEEKNRTWTEEERLKMKYSALLAELVKKYNNPKDLKGLLTERDKLIQEKENILLESNQTLKLKDMALEEKDRHLKEIADKLEETQNQLEVKDTQLANINKLMSKKQRLLKNKDKELETSKQQLESLRNELQDKSSRHQVLLEENKHLKSSAGKEMSVSTAPVRRKSKEWDPPNMSKETASMMVPGTELRLVLLGSAGCEKSAAGNIILNREKNQTDTSAETQQSESRQEEVDGKQVTVVETPDWFCPELSLEEVRKDVRRCIRLSAPGPHTFLLVIPVHQSSGVEREMMEKMEDIFGEGWWRNTLILFTVTDEEQEKNIEDFVQSGNQEIQRLVEKCGNRFHCLNIHQSEDGSQVSELLLKIEKMVEGNTEKFYSSEIYLEVESQIRAMERKIIRDREERKEREEREIKERIEKEVQNFLRKIEGVILEHEGNIKQLKEQTGELERQIREERDEDIKNELKRELQEEAQKRTDLERKIDQLKDQREREKTEMEEKHRQEMEKIRQKYGEIRVEAEKNLMKVIFSELQRNILDSKLKMQEEIIKQMAESNREKENLHERYIVMSEFHESALKNLKLS